MVILALATAGLSGFVFIFMYNKIYIKELINTGYKVRSIEIGTIEQMSNKLGIKLESL